MPADGVIYFQLGFLMSGGSSERKNIAHRMSELCPLQGSNLRPQDYLIIRLVIFL